MTYKITDETALRAKYAHFIKMKKVRVVTEVATLDQRAVKYAIMAGIDVPGVEKVED